MLKKKFSFFLLRSSFSQFGKNIFLIISTYSKKKFGLATYMLAPFSKVERISFLKEEVEIIMTGTLSSHLFSLISRKHSFPFFNGMLISKKIISGLTLPRICISALP